MGPERQLGLRPTARRAIVDAAIRLWAVNPGASLSEVALRAGVGRATLHRHFHGRDALVTAVARICLEEMREAVGQGLVTGRKRPGASAGHVRRRGSAWRPLQLPTARARGGRRTWPPATARSSTGPWRWFRTSRSRGTSPRTCRRPGSWDRSINWCGPHGTRWHGGALPPPTRPRCVFARCWKDWEERDDTGV